MAYARYKNNANTFATAANSLKNDKIETTKTELEQIKEMLADNEKEDFLSKKILETNDKTIKVLDNIVNSIDLDVVNVKSLAERLDTEEEARQEARKKEVADDGK